MIENDEQLTQSLAALSRFYGLLGQLRQEFRAEGAAAFTLLAQGPLDEIARLQTDIDAYAGVTAVRASEADLWVRLVGTEVRWKETPSSVLTTYLDALRKGVQAVVESTRTGRFGVRPTDEVKRACDFLLVGLAPGSLQVGLRVPDEGRAQTDLFEQVTSGTATVALEEFLSAAEWAASGEDLASLANRIADGRHRRHVLRALRSFVPGRRSPVSEIELFGAILRDDRRIRLTRDAANRLKEAVEVALAPSEERFVGDVREIDLDKRSFILRNVESVGELLCSYEDDLAERAWSVMKQRATVVGVRKQNQFGEPTNRLEVNELMPLDSAEPDE